MSRLNLEEAALRDSLNTIPEFAAADFATDEMRTFRGVVIRRSGGVRGLWSYSDGQYRWLPISSGFEPYVTPSIERALRQTMLMVLNSLIVRRAIRQSSPSATMPVRVHQFTAARGERRVA